MRRCFSKSWGSRLKRGLKQALILTYFSLLVFAFFNYRSHVVETMPNTLIEMARLDNSDSGRCRLDFDKLDGDADVNIFGEPSEESIVLANPAVEKGGRWKPKNCKPWQRIAIIIPYRDRLNHLHILLRRLHPFLQKQKIDYRIFVLEQSGKDKFNRGKLMNVGFMESSKLDEFDCLVFQDVDLLPEDDRNLYMCDGYARHLASAIDEMRYHVMYYNYAGGVIALNKRNFKRINGYANVYWGWGNEDDDFSARIQESGLLLTRPPPHIGRFKMVRHVKETRSEHGNEMFLGWKARWPRDGLNDPIGMNYTLVKIEEKPLYTQVLVDIGHPPASMDVYMVDHSKDVSFWWFLKYYYP